MPAHRKLTECQAEQVARRYVAGETIDELAAAFSVGVTAVRTAIANADVPFRRRSWRLISVDIDEVVRRYVAGETTMQLARAFDVDANTIRRRLHAAGVTLRPRGRRTLGT